MVRVPLGILLAAGATGAAVGCGEVAQGIDAPGSTGDASSVDGPPPVPDAVPGEKRVFVSSLRTNGTLGGLGGADQLCTALAGQAGLGGIYMAWLSDDVVGPRQRMSQNPAPYVLVDGRRIADSWADLTDGALLAPIDLTELGTPPALVQCSGMNGRVWTATTATGDVDPSLENCQGWIGNNGRGGVGTVLLPDQLWTESNGASCGCSNALPLYCFEQ